MARLGILGGTFDPPHLGHLILAAEASYQLDLELLLWVLTPDPPHKRKIKITPLQDRQDLLRAAITGDPSFELCPVDINRPGPHYAVDTVHLLKQQYPGNDWVYLMGGDSLRDLPTWYKPTELVAEIATLGVMVRPGVNADLAELVQNTPGLRAKVKFIDAPQVGISASDIRRRVAAGLPFQYLVPPQVVQIIQERGLYRRK